MSKNIIQIPARTYPNYILFLPENGYKATRGMPVKWDRTPGWTGHPATKYVHSGSMLAFGERFVFAAHFAEVCKVAKKCTDYYIKARETDTGLEMTYGMSSESKTKVILNWRNISDSRDIPEIHRVYFT